MKSKKYTEVNNSFEGHHWSFKKRLLIADLLFKQYVLASPYKPKPFVKSFGSFKEYENWKKKQKNPWYW